MTRASSLNKFNICGELDTSTLESPEHALLRSILIRAIYDLTPEAPFEARRDAIGWFLVDEENITEEDELTSFKHIVSQLKLGSRILKLIRRTIYDAESFEDYRIKCKKEALPSDIMNWRSKRKGYFRLKHRSGGIRVQYADDFAAPVQA